MYKRQGEGAALVYLALTGTVFRGFFRTGQWFGKALQRGGFLVFSYLITNLTLNIDRLVPVSYTHLDVYKRQIIGDTLDPKALGALLAHFENKIMFQGFVWNVNSFDQEGVQLGKVLAKRVLAHETEGALKEFSDLLNI